MAPPAACLSPVCCVPSFPASAPRRASPSSTRRLPRFAVRSSGGGGSRPESKPGTYPMLSRSGERKRKSNPIGAAALLCSHCWCCRAGDNESKAVLDAFFLGKAFAEALTERVESVVGEVFSVVGQWQAEQQKQVQDFQEEVLQRAQKAKERAATEVTDDKGPKTLREPSATIVTPAPTSPPPATPTQAE
ncbi:unnamed protein product [Urochloa decumbens]|uniref:Uncharacterized protein n=1 Tax=Urochloa decumbens TaxID=240449 RepID=A0ABC9CV22_9POAL